MIAMWLMHWRAHAGGGDRGLVFPQRAQCAVRSREVVPDFARRIWVLQYAKGMDDNGLRALLSGSSPGAPALSDYG
jgi:hypothetical protein